MNPPAETAELLDCIGEVIGVGGSCHRPFPIFVVLFVSSSRTNFKILCAKKGAQQAFDDEINSQTSQVLECGSIYMLIMGVRIFYIGRMNQRGLGAIESFQNIA
jgi:hypothetical protein